MGSWDRFAEAMILSIRGGQELLLKTQARYFQQAALEDQEIGSVALLEAVSMGSWDKLVDNCGLDSWKEVLAALVTYSDSATKQVLAGKLADRLTAAGGENKVNGLLCYMAAGDLEKLVSSWLGVVGEVGSPTSLQELVEVLVLARAAVQTRGLNSSSLPGGQLSAALAQYAALLAGQGSLATALTYIGEEGAGDKELEELRERLQKALTRTQPAAPVAAPAPVQPRANQHNPLARNTSGTSQGSRGSFSHGLPQNRDSRRTSVEPQFNNFNTGMPGQSQGYVSQPPNYGGYQNAAPTPAYNPPPATNQPQYTGFTPAPTNYGAPPQSYAPAPPSDPVPTFQPPPIEQVTSPTSLTSPNPLLRRNRAVDPSIAAGAPGSQYGYMQPTQQFGDQYKQQPSPYMQPQPTSFPDPVAPQPQPNMFTPDHSTAYNQPAPAPGLPPPAGHVPDQPGPGFTPPVSSGSGWNDPPPMMISRPAPVPQPATSSAQDPITHPIFGAAAPEPTPAPAPGWGGFQPAPTQQFQQPTSQGYQGFQPAEPANQPAPQPVAPAPEPAPAAPIPAEHQVIQDTLESLRSKCQQGAAAAHPQVRRKLEDVSLKLDILYDKLRKSVLSPTPLQGLHTILQHIWQYDYQACMQVISGLIAGGSFAEMSDFMPGVKVLLQVAQQQGVYVEYQK